jgi:hypothetical protein
MGRIDGGVSAFVGFNRLMSLGFRCAGGKID